MKILLACVGRRDPWAEDGSEGGIVTCYRKYKPEWVYLFPSMRKPGIENDTEAEAQATKEYVIELSKQFGVQTEVGILPLDVKNPTDTDEVLYVLRKHVRSIVHDNQEAEFITCKSTGTPAMQVAWDLLYFARILPGLLCKVINPKFSLDGERVFVTNVYYLEEEMLIRRIYHLLQNYHFKEVSRECDYLASEVASSPELKESARQVSRVMKAYHYWDIMRYKDAERELNKVLRSTERLRGFEKLRELIKAQLELLTRFVNVLKEQEDKPAYNKDILLILLDLFHNMQRRFSEGNYFDTLSRFWRIAEEGVYCILRKMGVEPSNVAQSTDTEGKAVAMRYAGKFNNLTLKSAFQTLEDWKPQYIKELKKIQIHVDGEGTSSLYDGLDDLRELRNQSTHGLRSVTEGKALAAVESGKHFVKFLLEKYYQESLVYFEDYPFHSEKYTPVLKNLINV